MAGWGAGGSYKTSKNPTRPPQAPTFVWGIIILVAKGKEACKRLLTQTQLAATKIRIRLRKTKDSKLAAHVAMKERLESAPPSPPR